jgi:hypothetical protein
MSKHPNTTDTPDLNENSKHPDTTETPANLETYDHHKKFKSIKEIISTKDKQAAEKLLQQIAELGTINAKGFNSDSAGSNEQGALTEAHILVWMADFVYPSNAIIELARTAEQRDDSGKHLSDDEIEIFCDLEGTWEFMLRCGRHIAYCHNCGIKHEELAEVARQEIDSTLKELLAATNSSVVDIGKKS